jgi:hypothetical protein
MTTFLFKNSLKIWLCFLCWGMGEPLISAQSCAASGKSLHQLQLWVYTSDAAPPFRTTIRTHAPIAQPKAVESAIFLPRWSAESLPFFCRIEHNWAKNKARVPIKFRLGSVEYVDWLEGKGSDWPRN